MMGGGIEGFLSLSAQSICYNHYDHPLAVVNFLGSVASLFVFPIMGGVFRSHA